MNNTTTDTISIFRTRAATFEKVLEGASGRWDAPTPCTGWTVADVVDHVISTQNDFLRRHGLADDAGTVPTGSDPRQAWRAHAAAALSVLERDGVAETTFDGYFGPTTIGDTMADFYGWDLVIHGWDVARATGQPSPIREDEAAGLAATADGWGKALYSEGICAQPVEVPPDAGRLDKLLGKLGRDPRWTPAQA